MLGTSVVDSLTRLYNLHIQSEQSAMAKLRSFLSSRALFDTLHLCTEVRCSSLSDYDSPPARDFLSIFEVSRRSVIVSLLSSSPWSAS
jgi:hypothetical protein